MEQSDFEYRFCSGLNEQQQKAVSATDRHILLLAVPGSGKTTVLVKRLGYMILSRHIAPEAILTMTFSNAAAREMKTRFQSFFEFPGMERMTFCTIHSLCMQIIRYTAQLGGRPPFSLLEESGAKRLIRQIYLSINQEYPSDSLVQDVQNHITKIKNTELSDEELDEKEFEIENMAKIYREYNRMLRRQKRMDFDDQLVYAKHILVKIPKILCDYQKKFPYICVDEAQDTSRLQHEIISLLSGEHGNLFMVGDEDQSIYGFRGADPSSLLNFKTRYPDALVLTMEQNYRSEQPIISASNRLIEKNLFRYEKRMIPTRSDGGAVEVIPVPARADQYRYLAEHLSECTEKTAVLYRNNDSSLPLIDLLERHGIAYNCPNRETGFFTHRIVTDFLDIIQFSRSPGDGELFCRIYYKIGLHLNRQMAEYACRESNRSGKEILSILSEFRRLSASVRRSISSAQSVLKKFCNQNSMQILDAIWVSLDYQSYIHQRQSDPGKYQILQMIARYEPDLDEFLNRLNCLKNLTSNHENSPGNSLILSTIHSSKGLEYENVYLLDVIDGILPAEREKNSTDVLQHEEDRRICYVGMTRAQKNLFVFSCRDSSSEFISSIRTGKFLSASCSDKPVHTHSISRGCPEILKFIQLEPGQKILHRILGPGVVQSVTGDFVRIQMKKTRSVRTFSLRTLIRENMLKFPDAGSSV